MDIDVICKLRNNTNLKKTNIKNKTYLKTFFNKKKYHFYFDKIWNENVSDQYIFDYIQQSSNSYRDKNIIVFGYSGSGKTYTINKILKYIIDFYKQFNNTFNISCIQLYNNSIYDVFNNNSILKYFKNNNLVIHDISKLNNKDFDFIIKQIELNRKINKTSSNDVSSRSCLIISITSIIGNYTIIDMPGQEIANINNNNIVNNEAKNINLNLLALKKCIMNYFQKKNYIPFRDSLLTLYLKKMFYSVCKVFFICNVNGEHNLFHQIDSMKYATCLVNKKKTDAVNYQKLLLEYSIYIQNIGLNYCDDNTIFKQIKNKNYNNIHKIKRLINENLSTLNNFKKNLEKILPN
jgi:hypothetical protein